jgi:hypothetical protein
VTQIFCTALDSLVDVLIGMRIHKKAERDRD